MKRRTFLSCLLSLPVLARFKPKAVEPNQPFELFDYQKKVLQEINASMAIPNGYFHPSGGRWLFCRLDGDLDKLGGVHG